MKSPIYPFHFPFLRFCLVSSPATPSQNPLRQQKGERVSNGTAFLLTIITGLLERLLSNASHSIPILLHSVTASNDIALHPKRGTSKSPFGTSRKAPVSFRVCQQISLPSAVALHSGGAEPLFQSHSFSHDNICISGHACMPGKTLLWMVFAYSSSTQTIPPRGRAASLCVRVVTETPHCFRAQGGKPEHDEPPQLDPAKCEPCPPSA